MSGWRAGPQSSRWISVHKGDAQVADLLFTVVAIAAFAALIAFVYACDRL